LERLNGVWNAVFEQLDLVRAKVSDRPSVLRRVQVHAHRLDASSKCGFLRGGRLVLRRHEGATQGETEDDSVQSRGHRLALQLADSATPLRHCTRKRQAAINIAFPGRSPTVLLLLSSDGRVARDPGARSAPYVIPACRR